MSESAASSILLYWLTSVTAGLLTGRCHLSFPGSGVISVIKTVEKQVKNNEQSLNYTVYSIIMNDMYVVFKSKYKRCPSLNYSFFLVIVLRWNFHFLLRIAHLRIAASSIMFWPSSNLISKWTKNWLDHLTVDACYYSLCIQLWILFINITTSNGLGTAEYPMSSGQKVDQVTKIKLCPLLSLE